MAFFPSYLKRRYQLVKQTEMRTPFREDHTLKYNEILDTYRKQNTTWEPHLFLNEYDLNSENEVVSEALYQIITNKELNKTLHWISKRILSTIGIDNYISIDVYIRIGTSMLNKLVEDGIITKESNIYYHDNFVRNTKDLLSDILEEDLPFLLYKVRLLIELPINGTLIHNASDRLIKETIMTKKEIAMIKRAKLKDEKAFTWIFKKYNKVVEEILYGYIKDLDEARDLVNVVFIKVHENLNSFSTFNSFGGWIRMITSRVAIDYIRSRRNRRYTSVDEDGQVPENSLVEYAEDVNVNHLTVSRILEVLDKYPSYVRKIFELHYMKGLSIETIASKLFMPVGTVKSILSRGRNKIRKQFKNLTL